MSDYTHVEDDHPRAQSIRVRELITNNIDNKVVALAGLIAYGRGEAFDYMLGEQTTESGMEAITADTGISRSTSTARWTL